MRYFIYCRKSSEAEDRQVLSIESQLKELREFAAKENLTVIKEFSESKTAKEPARPIFNQMLLEIELGHAQGIIAWHPDRCARNSIDGGKIIHLIDQKIIADLKFPTYFYDNSPHGIFNLSLAFSFSKLYVDNLSQNVKRGIREKLRRGEFPGPAPRGYINNLKNHTIEPCPITFELIKNIIGKFADGKITIPEIRKELYQSSIKTRTGNPVCYSTIREMIANPFYYGFLE
jgi:site-specific DNA recombinase